MTKLCPCDATKAFSLCCQPIISGQRKAASAEQLMRSRYSAYATQNAQYIFDTYAKNRQASQSLADIEQWAQQCHWVQVDIVSKGSSEETKVEFIAKYLQQGKLYVLQEDSSFVIENGQWRYLDGDIIDHKEIGKVKRNDLCPCQSGKKYKQCCA